MPNLTFRRATEADVPIIVRMLADDMLGAARETLDSESRSQYLAAFRTIDTDPNQFLLVAVDGAEIVGTMQLTFIAGLAQRGLKRGQIEAVRVASNRRGERIGEAMIAWALDQCRSEGCGVAQLTTNKARADAQRFYDRLGFSNRISATRSISE